MNLLSLVTNVGKRREELIQKANQEFIPQIASLEDLEAMMEDIAMDIYSDYSNADITESEWLERMADYTIISGMIGQSLGRNAATKQSTLSVQSSDFFPVTRTLEYLIQFYETLGKTNTDLNDPKAKDINPTILNRMKRYLVTPNFSWMEYGKMSAMGKLGYAEMRRISKRDKRSCKECLKLESMGWQPIGTMPVPGIGCPCIDRCRCSVEYR